MIVSIRGKIYRIVFSYLFDHCVIIARENFYDSLFRKFRDYLFITKIEKRNSHVLFDNETTRYIIF